MIARTWHGWTKPQDADAYETLLRHDILPAIHRISGYRGTHLLRRVEGEEVEFITITLWETWEAVQEFGGDHTTAVVPDRARKLLTRFDDHSLHYDALFVP
jgi:heme-degrading monooxygenase HmoA